MKEKVFIYIESNKDAPAGFSFYLVPERWKYYPSADDVRVGETEVSYSPPANLTTEEIRGMAIKTLQDRQTQVVAEAQKKKMQLQKKIDSMVMLPFIPASATVIEPDDILF